MIEPKPARKPRQTRLNRIDKAIAMVMEGESADPLLRTLTAPDQELLQEALAELRKNPEVADLYLRDLWRLDYERRPPSMTEFLEDPYWLGSLMVKSDESEGLFPMWKKLLIQDFDLDSRVHNLVISGSLGTGKTFCLVTVMLYRIAMARCLRNPQAFFGLTKGSQIYYATLSVTRSVVQETAFGDFLNFMTNCPFFIEECHFDPERKYAGFRIPIGRGIYLTAGSQGWHIIGRNAMGIALDEGNFRLEANPDLKAYQLYDEVRTRLRNRFLRMAGFLPAISILSSSARDESSFTERVKADIEKSRKEDPDQRIYSFPVYVIKAHTLILGKRWFKVVHGLKNVDPYVLKGWYNKEGGQLPSEDQHEEAPKGARVELVPENYFSDFRRNPKTALQNISGISTGGSFRFFGNSVDLEVAIDLGERAGLVNPCTIQSIPISEEDKANIWDFLNPKIFLTKQMSRIQPKRDPGAMRYVHLDLATRTQAGVSICHIGGRELVQGLVRSGGEVFDEYRVLVEYDFILSIVAGKTKPISLGKIINFLHWLRDVCGYPIALVTADQFQSVLPLQMLERQRFKTANLSVDRTKKPYEAWRAGFEERRIRMFRHDVLMKEAENLVDLGDKVDHVPELCLTGETQIPLLNGSTCAIADLVGQIPFWVYSNDTTGRVVPGLATARQTASVTSLVEVTLDNNEKIRCTVNHPWLLRNGNYVRADKLIVGQSLMPLEFRYYKIRYKCGVVATYTWVKTGPDWKWRGVHSIVSEEMTGLLPNGSVVHHYDFDSSNNEPSNLKQMTVQDHNRLHRLLSKLAWTPEARTKRAKTWELRYGSNEVWKKTRGDTLKKMWANMPTNKKEAHSTLCSKRSIQRMENDPAYAATVLNNHKLRRRKTKPSETERLASSERIKELNSIPFSEERKEKHRKTLLLALAIRMAKEDCAALDAVIKLGIKDPKSAKKIIGGGRNAWVRRFKMWGDINHSIKEIKIIHVEPTLVYDIEVEKWHNFGLAAGVFVHNSKDVADSAAGSYYSAVTFKDDRVINSVQGAEPSIYTNLNNDEEEKPPISVVDLDQYRKPTKSFTV